MKTDSFRKKGPDMLALDIVAGGGAHGEPDGDEDAPAPDEAGDPPAKSPDQILDGMASDIERLRASLRG